MGGRRAFYVKRSNWEMEELERRNPDYIKNVVG